MSRIIFTGSGKGIGGQEGGEGNGEVVLSRSQSNHSTNSITGSTFMSLGI
jgi:hypothetical protein